MNIDISYQDWKLDLLTFDCSGLANGETLIWQLSGEQTYRYVTRFFAEAKTLLNHSNPAELNQILWLLSHDVLNVIPEEYPQATVWADYFQGTKILFRDLFDCHCAPVLLKNLACKESALHGLGHWCSLDSDRVRTIIQDHQLYIPEKLKNYAQSAMSGCVL
jgi:hypothetical protein